MSISLRHFFFVFGLLVAAVSCTPDGTSEAEGTGRLSLRLGAEVADAPQDANALKGEFIHSLQLFLVDEAKSVKYIYRFTEEGTPSGSTKRLSTQTAELPFGAYTLYAFANMEGVSMEQQTRVELDKRLGLIEKGKEWDLADDAIIVDPAAGINLAEGRFIPMSLRLPVSFYRDGQTVEAQLVRLVSRVSISVANTQKGAGAKQEKLDTLSMGAFAQRVPLFEGQAAGVDLGSKRIDVPLGGGQPLAPDGGAYTTSFYVNATPERAKPLQARLSISGRQYTATTQRRGLPRNSIYPLVIQLTGLQLHLQVQAWVAPIGGLPFEQVVGGKELLDNYSATVPEGSTLQITPSLRRMDVTSLSGVTWTWTPEPDSKVLASDGQDDKGIFRGHLTAQPGQTATLQLTARMGESRTITYHLTLTTTPLAAPASRRR